MKVVAEITENDYVLWRKKSIVPPLPRGATTFRFIGNPQPGLYVVECEVEDNG